MKYLWAVLLPPVAVLMVGKRREALLNLVLTLCLYFPGMIHAIMVVNSYEADRRTDRLIAAQKG